MYVIFCSLDIGKDLNLNSRIVNFKNKKSNLVWKKTLRNIVSKNGSAFLNHKAT